LSSSKNNSKISRSLCAVIPFYNEKETIHKIIDETLNFVQFIFAVNDGSDDLWIEKEIDKSSVKFISLDKNYGKGRALRVGFNEAIKSGFEYVITLDADFQHDPKYIPELLEGLKEYDIVIGNRMYNLKGMPIQRRMSNKITSFLLSKKAGQKILDSQCGFRAYSSKVLQEVKTVFDGFEAESEILVRAVRKEFKIEFINIPTIYRNEKSKMKALQVITGFIKVLFI
jgi:glycosyltransferase involved in cell wall biosynthesis